MKITRSTSTHTSTIGGVLSYINILLVIIQLVLVIPCTAAMASSSSSSSASSSSSSSSSTTTRLVSECACGSARVVLQSKAPIAPSAVDCHCPACRKYHVAGFSSYLQVATAAKGNTNDVSVQIEGSCRTYRDTCDELGAVERIACRECYTKLATKPVTTTTTTTAANEADDDVSKDDDDSSSSQLASSMLLINMGPLVDETIPKEWAASWRNDKTIWQLSKQASWVHARPEFQGDDDNVQIMTGGCACGKHRYRIHYQPPQELQHCYCRLCRQLSGGAFMTWIPVYNEDIEWLQEQQQPETGGTSTTMEDATTASQGEPALVRTTDHGQRHICTDCGGALTIVYDEQPEMTWPAAAGIDDVALPLETEAVSRTLENVMHICCRYRQAWYQIPNDGLPRVQEAC